MRIFLLFAIVCQSMLFIFPPISTELSESSEHGIMALAALGLLHGDGTLATAALVELSRHKHNSEFELILFFSILVLLVVFIYFYPM